ncbi:23S rRNA (pseudouridine(1915)-N(3))-methyltransferase RlmH [bacterium]|nr:23S rRNA (pseudouridine(1915)-N(3))-methyltransferase RlmH [bacterium]
MAYRLRMICVGKTREDYLLAAERDYCRRIKPHAALELVQLKTKASYSRDTPAQIRSLEGQQTRDALQPDTIRIALDERGKQLDSKEFAALLNRHLIESGRQLEFIIGGPWGLDQKLRDSCHEVISLSRMTFNHRLVRLFLLEQIYRAFQILKGGGYAGK